MYCVQKIAKKFTDEVYRTRIPLVHYPTLVCWFHRVKSRTIWSSLFPTRPLTASARDKIQDRRRVLFRGQYTKDGYTSGNIIPERKHPCHKLRSSGLWCFWSILLLYSVLTVLPKALYFPNTLTTPTITLLMFGVIGFSCLNVWIF